MERAKEELKKFKNPRDLSSNEYENLTLELKCCFFLKPWNISAEIKTVEDWVNIFYMHYLPEEDIDFYGMGYQAMLRNEYTSEKGIIHSKNLCRNEVNSLIAFIKKIMHDEFYKKIVEKHKEK